MSTSQSRPPTDIDAIVNKYMDALHRVGGTDYFHDSAVHVCMVLALQEMICPAAPAVSDSLLGDIQHWRDKAALLTQQVTDMQNDNAELTQQLIQMDSDNANLTQRANGAAAKPVAVELAELPTKIDWSSLDSETNDFRISVANNRRSWREVPKRHRLEMIQCVLSQPTEDGAPMSMPYFNALKPEWMPAANGLPTSFGCSWPELPFLTMSGI